MIFCTILTALVAASLSTCSPLHRVPLWEGPGPRNHTGFRNHTITSSNSTHPHRPYNHTILPSYSTLNTRAVCHLSNMEIDKPRTDCPTKNKLDGEHCKAAIHDVYQDNPNNLVGCSAYCETSIIPHYGQEVPYDNGSCLDGTECTITNGKTITITRTWEINAGISFGKRSVTDEALRRRDDVPKKLTATFEAGASISYSKAVGYTTTMALKEEISSTHCGYWTFIPRMIESCGTYTEAEPETKTWGMYNENRRTTCNKKKLKSKKDWCNTAPHTLEDGKADGVNIFVKVDCKTNKLLPMDQQEEPYRYPGVSTAPKQ